MNRSHAVTVLLLAASTIGLAPAAAAPPCSNTIEDALDAGPHPGFAVTTWHPTDLPWNPDEAQALRRITLILTWENTPAAAGDLGIAVGNGDRFTYWNQVYQTNLGPQREEISLNRAELDELGWTPKDLRVGPSVSTGAYAASDLPYTLEWSATFDAPVDGPCGATPADPPPETTPVPRDSDPTPTDDDTTRDRLYFLLLVAGVVGTLAAVGVMVSRR